MGSDRFRRRCEDEEEDSDIFAPCEGYEDDDDDVEVSDASSVTNTVVQPDAKCDGESGVAVNAGGVNQPTPAACDLEQGICNGESKKKTGKGKRAEFQERNADRLRPFSREDGAPFHRRTYKRNKKRVEGVSTGKTEEADDHSPQRERGAQQPLAEQCSQNESENAYRGTQRRGRRRHEGNPDFRRARGGGYRGNRGRRAPWGEQPGNTEALPRRACYFQHEDRLAEPDDTQSVRSSSAFHRANDQDVAQRATVLKAAQVVEQGFGAKKTDQAPRDVEEKWLHDRFELLQDPNGLPLPKNSSSRRGGGRGRRYGPSGYRHRSGKQQRDAE